MRRVLKIVMQDELSQDGDIAIRFQQVERRTCHFNVYVCGEVWSECILDAANGSITARPKVRWWKEPSFNLDGNYKRVLPDGIKMGKKHRQKLVPKITYTEYVQDTAIMMALDMIEWPTPVQDRDEPES